MVVSTAPQPPIPQSGAICARCGRVLDPSVTRCPFDGSETIQCVGAGFEPGAVLTGRYLLGEMIGKGGWGMVFRARDLRDGSDAAVKVLSPQHSRDPASVTRFLREQRTIARLHHPHVVSQRDHGQTEHGLFIVMELLVGRTLGLEIHRRAPLPPPRAARIAAQICEALYATHSRGVIHRDLKPENVFLTEGSSGGDYAKVMDFGIAKLLLDESETSSAPRIYGTPHYVSPEQARGDRIDGRSDLYSTGIVLFEMLTGQLPFPREADMLTMQRRVDQPAPDLRRFASGLGIPGELCDVVRSLLARDPAGRPRNAAEARELLAAFDDLATPRPTGPRPTPVDTPVATLLHDRFAALDYSPSQVGREEERDRAAPMVSRLGEFDHGQVVLLSGPAGIGKSQLAGVLGDLARERGARVVEVECASGNAPLREIAGVIEERLGTARLAPDQARAAIRQRFVAAELGPEKMADDLLRLLRGEPDDAGRERDAAAVRDYRLHLALSMLAHLARTEPLVLVLEDAPRADPLTAALLAHAPLWFRSAGRGLLLIGVWTTGEGGAELPAEWRRIEKRFSERVALLELLPLDEHRMDDLLHAIGPIDDAARHYVARLAQGNPLYALQIVRHLKNERLLVHGYRGWQLAPGAHLERPVPPAMDDFARFRLERLRRRRGAGERAADLLERASLCGDRVPLALLRRVLEHEGRGHLDDVLPELLDTLVAGGFIRPGDWTEDGEVVFDHPLVRQAIAKGFEDRADTRPVHLAIAEAHLTPASAIARPRDIAAHLFAAGAADRALPLALESAATARAVADLALAGEDYRLALRCLEAMDDPPRASAIEAHLGLGDVLLLQGHPPEAEAEYRKVLDYDDIAEAWLGLGKVAEVNSRYDDALGHLERAERLYLDASRPHEAAEASLFIGKLLLSRSDYDGARARFEAVLRSQDIADPILLARTRIGLGRVYMWTGDSERSLRLLGEAADAIAGHDPLLSVECLNRMGNVRTERSEFAAALDLFERARVIAECGGFARGSAASLFSIGTTYGHMGSLQSAAQVLEGSLALYGDLEDEVGIAYCMCNLAWVSRLAGAGDEALEWARRAESLATLRGSSSLVFGARVEAAHALVQVGRHEDATSAFEQLLRDLGQSTDQPLQEADCHHGLGDIATARCDRTTARRRYAEARKLFLRAGRVKLARDVEDKIRALAQVPRTPTPVTLSGRVRSVNKQ